MVRLSAYDRQRLNEVKHTQADQIELLKEGYKDWNADVTEIMEEYEALSESVITENEIEKGFLALVAGLTSNINTSIVMMSKTWEEEMGSLKALEKASVIIPIIANFGFELVAFGDEEIQRVVVNGNKAFEKLISNKAVKFPMLVHPRTIEDNKENGWIDVKKSLLIGKAAKHDKMLSYDVINTINSVPLKIRQAQMIAELETKVVVDRKNKQGFQKNYIDYKLELKTAQLTRARTLEYCKMVGADDFYHNYGFDGRGRLYVNPTVLNYQQDSKHLITLSNTMKLNEDGYDNLKIDLANHYGKATPSDIKAMQATYLANPQDYPKITDVDAIVLNGDKSTWNERLLFGDTFHSGGSETPEKSVSGTDEPKLYANSLECMNEALAGSTDTGHLVGLDATTSVGQLIALSMGCKTGMLNTNVLMKPEEDTRKDFYQIMSDLCTGSIPRNQMKDAVLPSLYNSQKAPEDVFEKDKDLELFYEARLASLPCCEDFLGICNFELWNPNAKDHSWRFPDGHYASVRSYKKAYEEFDIDNDAVSSRIMIQFRNYAPCDYYIPLAANIIQSIDAYMVRLMIRKAAKRGFELLAIHDSFWCHPNHGHELSEMYYECLVQINDEQVFQSICKQLNPSQRVRPTKMKVDRWLRTMNPSYHLS